MTVNQAAVRHIEGRAIAVRGNDIDTDRIIPARYLRCVTFEGLGNQVFADERFDDDGSPKPHPFNEPRCQGASILVVNRNFGCGSSREHAPQALNRFGIKAIVGESFAEIFAGNCVSLGIPVCTADESAIRALQDRVVEQPAISFVLDLDAQTLTGGEQTIPVRLPDSARTALLAGTWNTLDVLLHNEGAIEQTHDRLPYLRDYR